jgi:hypothetical protein
MGAGTPLSYRSDMSMNCKQGDLALVIGSERNAGKMVTCIELLPPGSQQVEDALGPLWRVDRPMVYRIDLLGITAEKYLAPDQFLLPIKPLRPDLDEDELLEPDLTVG